MKGDQNHVEILSKISHWTSKFGKFAPKIARMGGACGMHLFSSEFYYHPRQLSKC